MEQESQEVAHDLYTYATIPCDRLRGRFNDCKRDQGFGSQGVIESGRQLDEAQLELGVIIFRLATEGDKISGFFARI